MRKKRWLIFSMLILLLSFSTAFVVPDNDNVVSAKTITLKKLKKQKGSLEKEHKKGHMHNLWFSLYKCKGNIIRWDEFLEHSSCSYTTYYKLQSDGKKLKFICTIEQKNYFDENADSYNSRYKIKKAGSSKYINLSNKKFKKLERKYKIIKEI